MFIYRALCLFIWHFAASMSPCLKQLCEAALQIQLDYFTCLRIWAAIAWLQSKIMRNSLPLFISLRRGLVSVVSRGSWRIFSLMLYLEGAIISSCSLIRPLGDKQQKNSHNDGIRQVKQTERWKNPIQYFACITLYKVY